MHVVQMYMWMGHWTMAQRGSMTTALSPPVPVLALAWPVVVVLKLTGPTPRASALSLTH